MELTEKQLNFINKFTTDIEVKSIDSNIIIDEDDERTVVGLCTTKDIDKIGDVVLPNGIYTDDYMEDPVVLSDHAGMPIGKCEALEITDEGLRCKTRFASTDRANEAWQLVKDNVLKKFSIGFIPLEVLKDGDEFNKITKDMAEKPKRIIKKAYMLEYSLVSIPCNSNAKIEAVSKSLQENLMDETKIVELEEEVKRLTLEVDKVKAPVIETPKPQKSDMRRFIKAVISDNEAEIKAVLGMSEGSAANGGYLVPTDFSLAFLDSVEKNSALLPYVTNVTTNSKAIDFPVAVVSTTEAATSGQYTGYEGVVSYLVDEGGDITASYPTFNKITATIKKLASAANFTSELLEDAEVDIENKVINDITTNIASYLDWLIINADGNGFGTGIISAGDPEITVTQAATGGIAAADIYDMYISIIPELRGKAVWIMNDDMLNVIRGLAFKADGDYPIFMPSNNLAGSPFGTLLGRPIIVSPHCPAKGTKGDIIFADLSKMAIVRNGGVRMLRDPYTNMLTDQVRISAITRYAVTPTVKYAVTATDGVTRGAFATLDTGTR